MGIDRPKFKQLIRDFKFKELFNELGWDNVKKDLSLAVAEQVFNLKGVALKKEFIILECQPDSESDFPDSNTRKKIDRDISKLYLEHLIIFTTADKSKQVWQLSIRQTNKPVIIHEVVYHTHQEPEIILQKLSGLLFTLEEEDKIGLVDVVRRVSEAFDKNAEKVTRKFYDQFRKEHQTFLKFIDGIDNVIERDWYASLMLNRLMFIYFIQKKGFLDNNDNYLRDKLEWSKQRKGKDKFYSFYRDFLLVLFHKGLGNPKRDQDLLDEIGEIPYLNGGLFDEHHIEKANTVQIPDDAFEKVFNFFDQYNWHLDYREMATGRDINPDVIGYIFEKYINDRAAMGAYYTKEDITGYISKNTIIPFLFDEVKKQCATAFQDDSSLWKMLEDDPDRYIYDAVKYGIYDENGEIRPLPPEIEIGVDTTQPNLLERRKEWNRKAPQEYGLPTEIWREYVERRQRYFDICNKIKNGEIREINDFITYNLNITQFAQDAVENYEGSDFIIAFSKAINKVTILDPTCGSGAFLFAAMNILEPLYETCIKRMREFVEEDDARNGRKYPSFRTTLENIEHHPNEKYYIFKSIILNNLYGVDIMNEAVEIAKLRLFLKLAATVEVDYNKPNMGLEPLPDLDFNIRCGNTLVGFAKKNEIDKVFSEKLDLYNTKDKIYEKMDVVALAYQRFKEIQLGDSGVGHDKFHEAKDDLQERLTELNEELNRYLASEYGIDADKKPKAYEQWKTSHQPFHWLAEFYEIIHDHGGFDVIIGNPPYLSLNKIEYNFQKHGISSGDIYGYVIIRCLSILGISGKFGFIVMHSLAFSRYFNDVRLKLFGENASEWFSFFARIPSGLFSGDVRVRNCIMIINRENSGRQINKRTTRIHRWFSSQRENLFQLIGYSIFNQTETIPMYSSSYLGDFFNNLPGIELSSRTVKLSKFKIYFKQTAYNWIAVSPAEPPCYNSRGKQIHQSQVANIYTENESIFYFLILLYNSKMFYSYWLTYGDEFHVIKETLESFKLPFEKLTDEDYKELEVLAKMFINELPQTIKYKLNAGKKVGTYDTSKLWHITDKSDMIFLKYLTDEPELVFEEIQNHVSKTVMTDN